MTLAFARSLPLDAGTNLKGEQLDSCWLFLLPALDLTRIAIVGDAAPGTAAALAANGREISRVDLQTCGAVTGVELVYVGHRAVAQLARDDARLALLRVALVAGSSVFFEPGARPRDVESVAASLGAHSQVTLAAGAAGGGVGSDLGLSGWRVPATRTPTLVGQRAAVAMRLARATLARRLGLSVSRGSDRVSDADTAFGVRSVSGRSPRPARREGLLLRDGEAGALPAYVRDLADDAGWPLERGGWQIAPPRGYRSQKVIFFVRGVDGSRGVVKLTQDERFNRMLDNEANALGVLARIAPTRGPRVPRLYFAGTHAGLSVVGEEALPGRAFVHVAQGGARCPTAGAAASALTDFGAATKRPASGVAEALADLGAAYLELFRPSPRVALRLHEAQHTLATLGPDLPLVFMHGDATVFNALVSDDGGVGLVDWENADVSGMPLWDLLHLLTTHHVWSEERSGRRARPAEAATALSAGRRLDPLRSTAMESYVEEVGVPREAVEPLRLLWAARHAVREARQLPVAALETSFHHQLLEHLVALS